MASIKGWFTPKRKVVLFRFLKVLGAGIVALLLTQVPLLAPLIVGPVGQTAFVTVTTAILTALERALRSP